MDRAAAEFGRIHVLYNNAGIGSSGSVAVAEEADWDRGARRERQGHLPLLARGTAAHGRQTREASIINQGSVAALVGVPNFAAYCAAKGAVVALTRSMAVDLGPRGIRVNVICPGTVYTPLMEDMLRARGDGDLESGWSGPWQVPAGPAGHPGGDRQRGAVPGQRRVIAG